MTKDDLFNDPRPRSCKCNVRRQHYDETDYEPNGAGSGGAEVLTEISSQGALKVSFVDHRKVRPAVEALLKTQCNSAFDPIHTRIKKQKLIEYVHSTAGGSRSDIEVLFISF